MKQKIIILLFSILLVCSAEKNFAQCTGVNISVHVIKPLSVSQTQVILNFGISPGNASYTGTGTIVFALKRPGLSDLTTTVAVSYDIAAGASAQVNFLAYTGYDYSATFSVGGCGTATTTFTTNHLQNVNTCIGVIYGHQPFSASPVTSLSAAINCAMPVHAGYTQQDLFIGYRVKGVPSSIREFYVWSRFDNWELRPFTTDVYDYTTEPALPINPGLSTLTGLSPGVTYEVFLAQRLQNVVSPRYDIFKPRGVCYFNSSPGAGVITNVSPLLTFTTPAAPCNAAVGNYTAPAISNIAGTNFYGGTITSASPVVLSTVTHKFTATADVLNPGFVTAVSGSGAFIANAYNPANCTFTRVAATGSVPEEGMGNALPETDSAVRNISVTMVPPENQPGPLQGISLYPNPAGRSFTIQANDKNIVVQQIIITDVSGKPLLTASQPTGATDISQLANGIYFCRVTTNKGTSILKLIKE